MDMFTVGELEAALFERFPASDMESWDMCGLAVGDRDTHVERIAFSLDMSTRAVVEAHKRGCKTLVTHHPPYIKTGPSEFGPAGQRSSSGPGRMVFEAARRGVNVINMHTNADRSVEVREAFAALLSCACVGNFEHLENPARAPEQTGLGALLEPAWDGPRTLSALVERCESSLGGRARAWGDPQHDIARFAYLNGSWSDPNVYDLCIEHGIDCVVVGETKYHVCVDAQPHLCIVDLGHDVSEMPIVGVLRDAVAALGFDERDLVVLDASAGNWWTSS